ncbi:MAG: hypothetical protein EXS36_16045 [Pedosphaera sp.]|nr:hypothetical protein [Pedosphaera sp.]
MTRRRLYRPGQSGARDLSQSLWAILFIGILRAAATDITGESTSPSLDRWVYPFGDQAGDRPVANTWGSFDPRFDTRDGQFLLGWNLTGSLTNQGSRNYLFRSLRVILAVAANNAFYYDPTPDRYETYLATNEPAFLLDQDLGRPVELYGAGYRGGHTADSFLETSPFGAIGPITGTNIAIGTRFVYAAMFDANGVLVDVSNNVGQPGFPPFETVPWAIGTTTNVTPGVAVPADALFSFDVDLRDPLILEYIRDAFDRGQLRLVASSLHRTVQFGVGGSYPQWHTREKILGIPPRLQWNGVTIRPDVDTDNDGLPDDWERYYFQSLEKGPQHDPDGDGASNAFELASGTNPTNRSSRFWIQAHQELSDGRTQLEFPIEANHHYPVQSSFDLTVWTPVPGSLTYHTGGIAVWEESQVPSTVSARFFRVVVE